MHTHHRRATARSILTASTIAILVLALAVPAASAAPRTKLMSQSTGGDQTLSESQEADTSATGNVVVFASGGDLLDGGDGNGKKDIYRRIVSKGKTKLVSRAYDGGLVDGSSSDPRISANGRYVVFESFATDLVKNPVTTGSQIYRRDLFTGKTALVSKGASGVADDNSWAPDVSANGRFVVFHSEGTNLVSKDTLGGRHVYLRDMKSKKTYLISKNNKGQVAQGGSSAFAVVSADGRFVAFESTATNLTNKETHGWHQVYLRDRKLGKTRLVSQHPTKGKAGKGSSTGAAISADGRYVVFQSFAENLIKWHKDDNGYPDIYKYDRVKKTVKRVSVDWKYRQLHGKNYDPDISADGKVITFYSTAPNVIKGGNPAAGNVYRRGVLPGSIRLISRNNKGARGNDESYSPAISANGKFVAFGSFASNLVTGGDDNGSTKDVFRSGPF